MTSSTARLGPGSWNTPSYRAVGRAVLDAAADAGNRWIFPDPEARGVGRQQARVFLEQLATGTAERFDARPAELISR